MKESSLRYRYKAIIVRVIDGDTVVADVDLGFDIIISNCSIRLFGINAPETRGVQRPEGLISKVFLKELLLPDTEVIIHTQKAKSGRDLKGKFGRYVATIYLDDVNINQLMIDEGFAIKQDY